jgi:polyisoprenyl-teichoic acid--peptidoglycan teichoic acid transferase
MRDFQDYTQEAQAARRRWWLWSLPVMVVAVIAGIGALSLPAATLGSAAEPKPQEVEASPTGWIEKMLDGSGGGVGGPLNVLVVGVDRRPPDSKEAQVEGTRTDTIMLVRLVPKTGEVKLLSVPRDLLVEVKPGVKDRINAAYTYGGLETTKTAIENYTRVPMSHHAVVDFEGFEAVVDAMGGVEVDIEDDFPDKWRMEEGLQRLNGHRALRYARYRGTACGDLDRIERQQELVAALRSKALKWNTVRKMPDIVKVMNENVETDLGFDEAISLGRVLIRRGLNAKMTSNQLKGEPETLPNGDEVLVPNEQANEAILEDFRHDGPNVRRSDLEPRPEGSSSRCE